MKTTRVTLSCFLVLSVGLVAPACDDGSEDTDGDAQCPTDPPEITEFTLTPTTLAPGGEFMTHAAVHNFEFSGHAGETGGHEHEGGESGADCPSGHYHVYLDDFMTNPLAMPDTADATANLPDDISLGEHTIFARLHNSDHTILMPEVIAEVAITVE